MRGLWALFTLAIVLVTAAPAFAQRETAESLIESGVAARRLGDDEGALALFTRAWELDHSSRSRAQMALAEQALGMWTAADRHLREALAATGDGWIQAHQEVLETSLADIGARLGELEVRCAIVGADVRVNGESLGTTPLTEALRVAAGTVTVEVVARGYLPLTRDVVIVAGQRARETFELHAESVFRVGAASEPRATDGGPGIVGEWWFWTILGVVVVGAGVGIGVGVATGSTTTLQDPLVPDGGLVITTLVGP